MSTADLRTTEKVEEAVAPRRRRWVGPLIFAAVIGFVNFFMGVYTVQPIGMLPNGASVIVWRGSKQPFFDSPDAECLRIQSSVSLLCRAIALGAAKDEITHHVLILPYMHWAYLLSTRGQEFNR
jgi:hypothetical protein